MPSELLKLLRAFVDANADVLVDPEAVGEESARTNARDLPRIQMALSMMPADKV